MNTANLKLFAQGARCKLLATIVRNRYVPVIEGSAYWIQQQEVVV